ncbi:hypothetical protein HYS28_02210 [Candidatus Uhrbacteria bacterium]|nr:hypothetical protein [Candidatus Uhrbacteria bacterium]
MASLAVFHNLRSLFAGKFFRFATIGSLVLLAGGVALIIVALFPEVQELRVVPLHYNIHVGVDKVGAWWQLFVPTGIGLVLTAVNLVVAAKVWHREQVIAYAAVATSLVVDAIIAIHVGLIVLLNLAYA